MTDNLIMLLLGAWLNHSRDHHMDESRAGLLCVGDRRWPTLLKMPTKLRITKDGDLGASLHAEANFT